MSGEYGASAALGEVMMAKTMKAAVVHEFTKPLSIEEVPIPEVGPGQILVKIEASGVCHTDLHAADGDWPVKPTPPFIPGHEGVGNVAAVGAGVAAVKEGDRVGVPWLHTACGHCKYCLSGWETLCDGQRNTGYSVNGGFAQYVLADPNYVGHLPDSLEFDMAAPILCAGVTVYKGLKETDTKPGDTVVISGIGGLGHIAVQYAKAMGRNVIAVDVAEEKLALAREMGADAAINALATDPIAEVKALCGGAEGVLVDRRVKEGLRPGPRHARQAGHDGPRRSAARRVRARHLRHRADAQDHPRLDRRHPDGSCRVPPVRGRREDQGALFGRATGEHQRHLRADARQQDRGTCRSEGLDLAHR